jgi:hypothetical protein
MEVSGQFHAPATLLLGNIRRYNPPYRSLGEPEYFCGRCGEIENIRICHGSNPNSSVDQPVT